MITNKVTLGDTMMTNDSFISNMSNNTSSWWFVFHEEALLLEKGNDGYCIPLLNDIGFLESDVVEQLFHLGNYGNTECYAVNLMKKPTQLLPAFSFEHIRQSHELLDNDALFGFAFRAKQLINWDKNTCYCGRCGHSNLLRQSEHSKQCTHCNFITFPHIAPAMLVLVWRDDEILLARSPQFKPGIYSILAGFVEPGETLEQTVTREVKEEVGINIKNLQYVGSQPWPFPSNLMLGFTAEYDSGELIFDRDELEDAQWFKLDQLPKIPKPISLSRTMIDEFVAENNLTQPV